MNKTQILLALVIISLIGMSSVYLDVHNTIFSVEPINAAEKSGPKHGEIKQYTKDKKLRTIVNYDQGVKHGTSYLYHDDGKTILLEMPYVNGKREGVSKKNYENGKLYAITSYKNDELHGPRNLYYTSGQLKAVINYGYGHPGIGSVEYLINGKEKEAITIKIREQDNIIWLDTSRPCKKKTFYIGKLIGDQFLDPLNKDIKLLLENNGQYYVDTKVYTPSYLKYQQIICLCESIQGNSLVLKTSIN